MEISGSTTQRDTLLNTIDESRSFKRNRCAWTTFGGATGMISVMFVILCSLSAWSIGIGHDVAETLVDVQEMIPDIRSSLTLLREICAHENFTRSYGDICK